MKKRVLSLFLCVLLLFSLASCTEEEVASVPPEYGTFYTADGILQNSHITLVIENESLVAPVTELSYALYDNSDFRVIFDDMQRNNHKCINILEIYRDGEWQLAPMGGTGENLGNFADGNKADPKEHQVRKQEMEFSYIPTKTDNPELLDGGALKRYYPLEAGVYRVRVWYSVYTTDESVQIPEGQLEAVAYFTVTDGNYDIFEQKDGILQCNKVKLEIKNETLSAPVSTLKFALTAEYAMLLHQQKYADVKNMEHLLEIFEGGEWKQAPCFGEITHASEINSIWKMEFWEAREINNLDPSLKEKRYLALEAGQYRLRVRYEIDAHPNGVVIPEGQLEAVAYFTVTAPENG